MPITLSTTETITDFATGIEGTGANTINYSSDGFAYLVITEPKFTAFNYDSTTGMLSFTWDSASNFTYSIHYTDYLNTAFTDALDISIPSGGFSISYGPVATPLPNAPQLFFKVTRNVE